MRWEAFKGNQQKEGVKNLWKGSAVINLSCAGREEAGDRTSQRSRATPQLNREGLISSKATRSRKERDAKGVGKGLTLWPYPLKFPWEGNPHHLVR